MKEQFTTREIALAMKELGFDEPCIAMFNIEQNLRFIKNKTGYPHGSKNSECEPNVLAPLWQQVIDWFREKYTWNIILEWNSIIEWSYTIAESTPNNELYLSMSHKSYYEAREQAILKTIEICKQK